MKPLSSISDFDVAKCMAVQLPLFAVPPRILSLRQPWLDLIRARIKGYMGTSTRGFVAVETRTWPTDYRGTVFLHASAKKPTDKECGTALDYALIARERDMPVPWLDDLCFMARVEGGTHLTGDARFGRILATATLTACEPYTPALVSAGIWPYTPGERRFAWHLADVQAVEPGIPWKGGLGLRIAPAELQERVAAAMVVTP